MLHEHSAHLASVARRDLWDSFPTWGVIAAGSAPGLWDGPWRARATCVSILVFVGVQGLRVRGSVALAARHAHVAWDEHAGGSGGQAPRSGFRGPSPRLLTSSKCHYGSPEWLPSLFPMAREPERLFTHSLGPMTCRDFPMNGRCLSRGNTPMSDKRSEKQVPRSIFCLCREPKHTNATPG